MPDIMAQMLVTDGAADKKPTRRATLGCAGGFGAGNGDGPQRLRSLCQLPATPSRLRGYGTLGDPKRTKGATTKAIVGTYQRQFSPIFWDLQFARFVSCLLSVVFLKACGRVARWMLNARRAARMTASE